jgi:hypothetical protein
MNIRRPIRIAIVTAGWLLASPSLQFSVPEWIEVGAPPALAKAVKHPRHGVVRHRPARRVVRGSSAPVFSNQPGLYPMQTYAPPAMPGTAATATQAPPVPGYPQVPTVAILPRGSTGGAGAETFSDKVVRCTHQGSLGGLPGDQQGAYVTTCAQ